MKLGTVLVAGLLLAVPGAAAHTFVDSQTLFGFPVNYAPWAFPCNATSSLNGLHGFWYDMSWFPDHEFLLTVADPVDVDPYFYDSNCDFISNGGAAMGVMVDEEGVVPTNAAFLLVWAKAGHGTYSMTIQD